jgi:hypothetical protein
MSAGKTVARGYGAAYQRARREWAALVKAGGVACARCGKPIVDGKIRTAKGRVVSSWHLGHDDWNRSIIRGPEHWFCNLGGAGRKAGVGARARAARRAAALPPVSFRGPLS